jgi:uncharacterized membrane protein YeaQ/YmgE (transglycosylase-associated protein family)
MGILAWLVIGAIAGWLADMFVGGGGVGLLGDIVIGIIETMIGGWAAGRFFGVLNAISGFNLTTFVVAFLGAAVVLIIANAVS